MYRYKVCARTHHKLGYTTITWCTRTYYSTVGKKEDKPTNNKIDRGKYQLNTCTYKQDRNIKTVVGTYNKNRG